MSEVKRYAACLDGVPVGKQVVLAEDYDAALAREAALREELSLIIKSFDELAASVGFSEARLDQTGDSPVDCANQLQQRLTAVEKLFDAAVTALNEIAKVSRIGEKPFEIATLAIGEMSALKPAEEGEGS